MRYSSFYLLIFVSSILQAIEEKHIVIVTGSYNNSVWCEANIDSVVKQKYNNYHWIYIDDFSTDNTFELVNRYINKSPIKDKVTIKQNKERCSALHNHYYAIHSCQDTDIIIILDGDDFLYDENVLSYINSVYQDPNIWLTYGQFIDYPNGNIGFCCDMPQDVVKENKFRKYVNIPSHLRTFYAGLFKRIKQEDLMLREKFYSMDADIAAMFPMIEMARDHFKFISQPLLIYNADNPINDHKVSQQLQQLLDLHIRSIQPYEKIDSPF